METQKLFYVKLLQLILILFLSLFLTTSMYAHTATESEKRQVYNSIQSQLEKGNITVEVAQKQWIAYIRCCRGI